LKVLYFAWVRQKIGTGEEHLALPAGVTTIAELIGFLRMRGNGYAEAFENPGMLRAAVNQEHTLFDKNICDTDEIAFFPPVTGG